MRPPTANRRRPARARRSVIAALCLLVAGLGAAHALAARGGLSVTPGILEHVAQSGGIGALTVSNTSSRPMKVSLAARPWVQSRSGSVVANRRGVLGNVRVSRRSLRLAAGATRTVGLSLARRPRGRSLYGAIEATGVPRGRSRGTGVRVAYRLVTSLRLYPPPGARRYSARPKRLFQHGSIRRGGLFLAVKNAGNTIDPIGGRVHITGNNHTLSGVIASKSILPGATVNLRLASLRGSLPRGRYRVGGILTQAGQKAGWFRVGMRLR
jgi:hypothetical protein